MGTLLPSDKPKIIAPALEKLMEEEMADLLTSTQRPKSVSTEALINERGKTHGDYVEHATISQRIKRAFGDGHHISKLNDMQVESLEMIAHKIGRILAGDPDFRDHWDDIAGYAKLVADRCSK